MDGAKQGVRAQGLSLKDRWLKSPLRSMPYLDSLAPGRLDDGI